MKLCKPVVLTSKGILVPFLREHFLASDPPHQVLATSFEFRRGEGVDVLALAPEGRLVVVLAHLDEPSAVVEDLLRRLHWMIENAPLVQRLFPTANIDRTRPPRMVLAVPRLAERMRDVLRYFTATELAVYEYRLVEVDREIALLVEVAGQFPHVDEPLPAVQAVREAVGPRLASHHWPSGRRASDAQQNNWQWTPLHKPPAPLFRVACPPSAAQRSPHSAPKSSCGPWSAQTLALEGFARARWLSNARAECYLRVYSHERQRSAPGLEIWTVAWRRRQKAPGRAGTSLLSASREDRR